MLLSSSLCLSFTRMMLTINMALQATPLNAAPHHYTTRIVFLYATQLFFLVYDGRSVYWLISVKTIFLYRDFCDRLCNSTHLYITYTIAKTVGCVCVFWYMAYSESLAADANVRKCLRKGAMFCWGPNCKGDAFADMYFKFANSVYSKFIEENRYCFWYIMFKWRL